MIYIITQMFKSCNMDAQKESVTKLIEEYTKEIRDLPDKTMNIKIAERIQKSDKEAKEAKEALQKIFKGQRWKR